jgi:sugar/nucleoside kinase (ribokinase family)
VTPAGQYLDVPSPYHGRPVRNVVGAGDTFRAGLAAYIATHYDSYVGGRMDYREACLWASATSYLYLSRDTDIRPFSLDDLTASIKEAV